MLKWCLSGDGSKDYKFQAFVDLLTAKDSLQYITCNSFESLSHSDDILIKLLALKDFDRFQIVYNSFLDNIKNTRNNPPSQEKDGHTLEQYEAYSAAALCSSHGYEWINNIGGYEQGRNSALSRMNVPALLYLSIQEKYEHVTNQIITTLQGLNSQAELAQALPYLLDVTIQSDDLETLETLIKISFYLDDHPKVKVSHYNYKYSVADRLAWLQKYNRQLDEVPYMLIGSPPYDEVVMM